jgi:hypothetical protein
LATLRLVQKYISGLPEVTEQDHHGFPSFRVAGKIFATLPDPLHLHIMLPEPEVQVALVIDSTSLEELRWGQRIAGVRVDLRTADLRLLSDLISLAWRLKAPKRLLSVHPDPA